MRALLPWNLSGVALLAASFATSGCVRHFDHLPDSAEFELPTQDLWRMNPELARRFNMPWANGWGPVRPYAAQDLIDSWGEPDSRRPNWWMYITWLFPLDPEARWEWRKADKRVIAWVQYPVFYGFEALIGALFIETVPETPP